MELSLERYKPSGHLEVHRFLVEWHATVEYGAAGPDVDLTVQPKRALRENEIRRAGDRSLVCIAQADWAFATRPPHPTLSPMI